MPRASLAQLQPGQRIDRLYEIEERIGVGGMATVYRARQTDTGKRVALKVIDLGDEDVSDTRRRFFNELLLATRVRHANIVSIQDFGFISALETPYIVMELLQGRNLRQQLRRYGPLLYEEAIPLFLGALSALADAHEQGVVHKDLKPSNLFLCSQGEETSLVVVDFGVAVRVREGSNENDDYHGTPRYSPPEYIRHREVGPRLDVYQMGLVFCEAISGRSCVKSKDTKEAFMSHLRGTLDVPEELLGPQMTEVIRTSLSVDPQQRFADAGAFYQALQEAAGVDASPTLRRVATPKPVPDDSVTRVDDLLRGEEKDVPSGILDWETAESASKDVPAKKFPSEVETAPVLHHESQTKPTLPPPVVPASSTSTAPNLPLIVAGGALLSFVCFMAGVVMMWLLGS